MLHLFRARGVLVALGLLTACALAHGPFPPPPGGNPIPPVFVPRGIGQPGPLPVPQPDPVDPPVITPDPPSDDPGNTPRFPAGRNRFSGSRFGSNGAAGFGAPGGGISGGGGRRKTSGLGHQVGWEFWWGYNREEFIALENKLRYIPSASVAADLDVGAGAEPEKVIVQRRKSLNERIVKVLSRAAGDSDFQVRAHSLVGLAKAGAGLESIMKGLADKDYRVQQAALIALGLNGDAKALPTLLGILNDSLAGRRALGSTDSLFLETRMFAALAVGLLGDNTDLTGTDAVRALLDVIHENKANLDLTQAATVALGVMGSGEAAPALVRILEDTSVDGEVRGFCADALGKIGDRSAVAALTRALGDKKTNVRRSAAVALGQVATPGDEAAVKALVKASRAGKDRAQKNFAIISLGQVGGKDASAWLARLVQKGDKFERTYGALALGLLCRNHPGAERATIAEILAKRLETARSMDERGAYAVALGLMRHDEAAPRLIELLSRKGAERMRMHVCLALGMMNAKKAVPALLGVVREKSDRELRTAAAIALGHVADRDAVRELEKLFHEDAGIAIRGAALRGLGLIGGKNVVLGLQRVLFEKGSDDRAYPDVLRMQAAQALSLLADKRDVPQLAAVSSHTNYLSQRGGLARLFGKI